MSKATYQVLDHKAETTVDTAFEVSHVEIVEATPGYTTTLALYGYTVDGVSRHIYLDETTINQIRRVLTK